MVLKGSRLPRPDEATDNEQALEERLGLYAQGSVTFATAATATVTFDEPQPDTDYYVAIAGQAQETFWVTSKARTGFTLNSSNASSTATVDWIVMR